jgi:hypothetical protein
VTQRLQGSVTPQCKFNAAQAGTTSWSVDSAISRCQAGTACSASGCRTRLVHALQVRRRLGGIQRIRIVVPAAQLARNMQAQHVVGHTSAGSGVLMTMASVAIEGWQYTVASSPTRSAPVGEGELVARGVAEVVGGDIGVLCKRRRRIALRLHFTKSHTDEVTHV